MWSSRRLPSVRSVSLRLSAFVAFLPVVFPLPAAAETGDYGLGGYLFRVALGLGLLAASGWALVRYGPRRFRQGRDPRVRVVSVLPLGRDVLYVLRLGPDVIAVLCGRGGSDVLGRWRADEWPEVRDEPSVPPSA